MMFSKTLTSCLVLALGAVSVVAQGPIPNGIYTIRSIGRVFNVQSSTEGGNLVVKPAIEIPGPNEQWDIQFSEDSYTIKNVALNWYAASTIDNAVVTSETPSNFAIALSGFGEYTISKPGEDLVWAANTVALDHSNIELERADGTPKQHWALARV